MFKHKDQQYASIKWRIHIYDDNCEEFLLFLRRRAVVLCISPETTTARGSHDLFLDVLDCRDVRSTTRSSRYFFKNDEPKFTSPSVDRNRIPNTFSDDQSSRECHAWHDVGHVGCLMSDDYLLDEKNNTLDPYRRIQQKYHFVHFVVS